MNSALKIIDQDLHDKKFVRDGAILLVHYLFAHKDEQLHLKYVDLAEIVGTDSIDLLASIATYCSGARLPIMKQAMELIIENDNWILDEDAVFHAVKSGEVYHPETGNLLENGLNYIYPYFTASEEIE